MKITLSIFIVILSLFLFTSCKVEPKEINYGNDHCHFCDMTVVDKTHAAQYVTKKGKAFMFDAIECMVNELDRDNSEDSMSFLLVADYANPGNLIDAKTATYLVSKKIKSPMGANLSAFSSKEIAQEMQTKKGGEIFTWEQLKEQLAR